MQSKSWIITQALDSVMLDKPFKCQAKLYSGLRQIQD